MTPPPAPPIRVLIADDHPVVRQGLRTFLGIQDDIEVVGEAEDGTSAVTLAESLKLTLPTQVPPRAEYRSTKESRRRRARSSPALTVPAYLYPASRAKSAMAQPTSRWWNPTQISIGASVRSHTSTTGMSAPMSICLALAV